MNKNKVEKKTRHRKLHREQPESAAVPVRAEWGGSPAAGGGGRSYAGAPAAASLVLSVAAAAAEEVEGQERRRAVEAAGRGGCAWPAQWGKAPGGWGNRRATPLLGPEVKP
jgi:hypothetical protein